jgi:murein L,D-transpeptidase YafK
MIAILIGFAHGLRAMAVALLAVITVLSSQPARAQLPHIGHGKVDLVVIYKKDRLLQLKRRGQVIRSYDVALGTEPVGHKRKEGDGRTPEGVYTLDWRNANSQFYRSMHISYPKEEDQVPAGRWGVTPGGLIMIHGLPNGRQANEVGHPGNDWTNGCIAVTNDEMDEIWSMVDDGTTIIIFP